jgi:hypothetical protein
MYYEKRKRNRWLDMRKENKQLRLFEEELVVLESVVKDRYSS